MSREDWLKERPSGSGDPAYGSRRSRVASVEDFDVLQIDDTERKRPAPDIMIYTSPGPRRGGFSGSDAGKRRRRKKSRDKIILAYALRGLCVLLGLGLVILAWTGIRSLFRKETRIDPVTTVPSYVTYSPLTVNSQTRPGIPMSQVKGIVIHASESGGVSAMEMRDTLEAVKDSGGENAGTHFIIGTDGTAICCVPPGEVTYATEGRNLDTVSVTFVCGSEEELPSGEGYDRMVELTAWLCREYGLTEGDVMTHCEATGVRCPQVYVENAKAWETFLADVHFALSGERPEYTTAEAESASGDSGEKAGDDDGSAVEVGEEEPLPEGAVEE